MIPRNGQIGDPVRIIEVEPEPLVIPNPPVEPAVPAPVEPEPERELVPA